MADEYPRETYRDLLQAKANGFEINSYQLEVWRREEELIRVMMQAPSYFRSCSIHPVTFEAVGHALAWQAYELIGERYKDQQSIEGPVLISTMHRIDPVVLEGRRGQAWIDALLSEDAIPPELALSTVVQDMQQHHRVRDWAVKISKITTRVGVDTNFAGLQSDLARTGLEMHLEAQSQETFTKPLADLDWDPNEREMAQLVRTYIPQLDETCGGGHGRGEFCAIGGGTNHGKSYFAAKLCRLAAENGKTALYLSTEDSRDLMHCRMMASFTEPRCSPMAIRTRRADPAIVTAAIARMKEVLGPRFFALELKKATVEHLCNVIRLYRWSKKVDIVVVDYLQAVTTEEDFRGNRVQQVGYVINALKKTATETGVALYGLSQYARDQYRDGTEPDLQGFKYCGDIENEAELAILLWRDASDVLHVKIPKIKWAKAANVRFIIPTDPTTGWMMDWEHDFGGDS